MRNVLKPTSILPILFLLIFSIPATAADAPSVQSPATTPATAAPAPATAPKSAEPQKTGPAIRLGYVDPIRIGAESSFGKEAQTQLKEKVDKLTAQIEARKKVLEKRKAALEAKLPTLGPKERKAKAKEFDKMVEEYRSFAQNADKELQTMEKDFTLKIAKQVEQASAIFGKSGDYAAIIVKQELLYIGSGVEVQDVTDEILKLVNEQGKK
ncbi:MAG: OmpH family outer membrane protein [Geobacter sp.]|nr:OmpH family outer membrane protein [Geobacter sp.]